MRGQRHAPVALYPRERPGTHCAGGWVGPRAGLDRCRKSRPPPGFDPRTVRPVGSRYTNYATRPTFDPQTVQPVASRYTDYANRPTLCLIASRYTDDANRPTLCLIASRYTDYANRPTAKHGHDTKRIRITLRQAEGRPEQE